MGEGKDVEPQKWISSSIEEIQRCIEDMKWQKLLTLFPDEFGVVEGGDPRSKVLLTLSWLLTDLFDTNWARFTPIDVVQILRDIADAITNVTKPN